MTSARKWVLWECVIVEFDLVRGGGPEEVWAELRHG